jgi:energy-coupling factor transport system substrate-specific component
MNTRKIQGVSFLIATMIILLFLAFIVILNGEHFLLFSFICLLASCIPFYWRFEHRDIQAREIVFLAVLATIASISRVPFAIIPSVQPTSFVIIITGVVMGPESGFIVGSTSALVSNMFLGQGPWTPWQMFAWGMMGMTAGLLRKNKISQNKYIMCFFGFVWGFIFGWIMDLWYLIAYIHPLNISAFFVTILGTAYFDLMHALSNVFFILLFYKSWQKIIGRFKTKYGLLN